MSIVARDIVVPTSEAVPDLDALSKDYKALRHDVVVVLSPEEKQFVWRLDLFCLTYLCISQIIKYLDQQNISAAYVSGMKEDLDMYGNEYNLMITCFSIGYAAFVIPSQVIIGYVRPSIWLPTLELVWGGLTACMAAIKTARAGQGLRFLIGACEASCYPGAMMLLMIWYTPAQLGKRIGLYHSMQSVGSIVASVLQGSIYTNMNGLHGIAGWRWLFIINGIMTVFVACLGYLILPDLPERTNKLAFWMKPDDGKMGRERYKRYKKNGTAAINFRGALRIAKDPVTYLWLLVYTCQNLAVTGTLYFNLWLKSLKNGDGTAMFTVAQVNYIPIAGFGITMIFAWLGGIAGDLLHSRYKVMTFLCLLGITGPAILTAWEVPMSAKWYAYFSNFASLAMVPVPIPWLSELHAHDSQAAHIMTAIGIVLNYVFVSWASPIIWPASSAPRYPRGKGWTTALAVWIATFFMVQILKVYEIRVQQPKNDRIAATRSVIGTDLEQPDSARGDVGGSEKHVSTSESPLSAPR